MNWILQLIFQPWTILNYFFSNSEEEKEVKNNDKGEERTQDTKESYSSYTRTLLNYFVPKSKEKEEDKKEGTQDDKREDKPEGKKEDWHEDKIEDRDEDKKESDSSQGRTFLGYLFTKSKEKKEHKDEDRKEDKIEDKKVEDKIEDRTVYDSPDNPEISRDSNETLELSETEKLVQDLKELLLRGNDSDVTIRVKDKSYAAHKCILRARTPVFSSMFEHDMKEKTTGVVDIGDCEPGVFGRFLHYVYTGTVEGLTEEDVFGLYMVADKYQVDGLKTECVERMKSVLSVDSFCDVVTLAVRHGERELLRLATAFFADKVKKIILTVKWQILMERDSTLANELLIKALVPSSNKRA